MNQGAVSLTQCIDAAYVSRVLHRRGCRTGLVLGEEGTVVESMTTFDSTKESLLDLLQSIKQGKTQLPDFQRGWVWDDDHIRSLLASVSLSFPIGAVVMLQTGNPDVRFKPRLVEGLPLRSTRARKTHPRRPAKAHLALSGLDFWETGHTRDSRKTPSIAGITWTSPRLSVQTAIARMRASAFPKTDRSGTSAAK